MKWRICNKKPWFFPIIRYFFPAINWEGTNAIQGDAFVFGSTAYSKDPLNYFQKAHEFIHVQQQRGNWRGAIKWWYNYIIKSKFRLAMETEAYSFEHYLFRKYEHDRNKQSQHLDFCARAISGPLYKNLLSYEKAKKIVLSLAKDGKMWDN